MPTTKRGATSRKADSRSATTAAPTASSPTFAVTAALSIELSSRRKLADFATAHHAPINRVHAASAPTATQAASAAAPATRSPCTATRTSTPTACPRGGPLDRSQSRRPEADRLVLAAYNRSRGARDRGDRYAAPCRAREWTGAGQLAS